MGSGRPEESEVTREVISPVKLVWAAACVRKRDSSRQAPYGAREKIFSGGNELFIFLLFLTVFEQELFRIYELLENQMIVIKISNSEVFCLILVG